MNQNLKCTHTMVLDVEAIETNPTENLQRYEYESNNQFKASLIPILDLYYLQHYEENRIAYLIHIHIEH